VKKDIGKFSMCLYRNSRRFSIISLFGALRLRCIW